MTRKIPRKWDWWLVILSLIMLWISVVVINFPWGKWFSGWDNLHPEFDYLLNIERALFGVWQGNQGLGHVGGHGYAATLLHTLSIWVLDLFMPTMYVRAAFTMLMLLVGSLGTAIVTRKISGSLSESLASIAGLLAGVFYMLHLGTVQQFYFQLEAFIIFYGLLPWMIWGLVRYLTENSRKNLWCWVALSILFSPIGFIPPLFIVYFIVLLVWTGWFLVVRRTGVALVQVVSVLLISIVCNSYWLLPVTYYTFTGSDVYLESQNNQLSTQDFQLQSESFGGAIDVALVRGFVIDALDSSSVSTDPVFYAMQSWHDHLEHWWVVVAGMFLFGGVLVGVLVTIKTHNFWAGAIIITIGFGVVALGQRIWGIELLSDLLKEIPIINQAFRASFTKISVLVVFIYAVLFGIGVAGIIDIFKIKRRVITGSMVLLGIFAIVMFGWPVFKGELLYDRLETKIPSDYFELFAYLKTQPEEERIAIFPLTWQWGWEIHDWGYSGSGFLWYGIKQPILHRSFDVWSRENETYYHQIAHALMNGEVEDIANVLMKYKVRYVLYDPTLVYPGFGIEATGQSALEELLKSWEQVEKVGNFGALELYKISASDSSNIWAPYSYQEHQMLPDYLKKDLMWSTVGSYLERKSDGIVYPFAELLSARPLEGVDFESDSTLSWTKSISPGEYEVRMPAADWGDVISMQAKITSDDESLQLLLSHNVPKILIDGEQVNQSTTQNISFENSLIEYLALGNLATEIVSGSHDLYFNAPFGNSINIVGYGGVGKSENLMSSYALQQVQQCWTRDGSVGEIDAKLQNEGLRLRATDASACLTHRLGRLAEDRSQLIKLSFEYRGNSSSRPLVCLVNEQDEKRRCYNGDTSSKYSSSENWRKVEEIVPVFSSGIYWLDVVGRSGDFEGETAQIEYRNISIDTFDEIVKVDFPSSFWEDMAQEEKKIVSSLNGDIGIRVVSNTLATWNLEGQAGNVKNCNVFNEGTVASERLFGGVRYQSKNGGVACESTFFSQLMTDRDMLLHLNGDHISGRGLKYYLRNLTTGRQDVEYLFDQSNFNSFLPLLASKKGSLGFSFDLENRSFAHVVTENIINDAELISFPIDYLSKISLVPKNMLHYVSINDLRKRNEIVIHNQSDQGDVIFSGYLNGSGLIALDQGYDEGWLAYEIGQKSQDTNSNNQTNSNSQIPKYKQLMPWWFGEKLEHVRVNGWANGWLVPTQTTRNKQQETNEEYGIASPQARNDMEIVMVYWPQYLEWLGLGVLGITFGVLMIVTMKKSRAATR